MTDSHACRPSPASTARGGPRFSIGEGLLAIVLLGSAFGLLRALGREYVLVLPAFAGAGLGTILSRKFRVAVGFACILGAVGGLIGLYLGLAGTPAGAAGLANHLPLAILRYLGLAGTPSSAAAIPAGLPLLAFNFGAGGAILGLVIGAAAGVWRDRRTRRLL
jgi:hypothetical protein